MTNQNLIIYNFQTIFEILSEVKNNLNFKIIKLDKDELQSFNSKNYENFVFLNQKKILNIDNQLVLNQLPIKLNVLVEKINIQFLKLNYKDQSNYIIVKYIDI